jgi:hypothetical protein
MQRVRVPNQVQIPRRSRRPPRCFRFLLEAVGVDAVRGTADDGGRYAELVFPAGARLLAALTALTRHRVLAHGCRVTNAAVRASAGGRQ